MSHNFMLSQRLFYTPLFFCVRYCRYSILLFMAVLALASCTVIPPEDLIPPEPLHVPSVKGQGEVGGLEQEQLTTQAPRERFRNLPRAGDRYTPALVAPLSVVTMFPESEPADITISVSNMTLPTFINEVFANQLKLDFQLAPELIDKKDLVSLRVTEPRNRQGLFEIAEAVLQDYGVVLRQEGGYLRIAMGASKDQALQPPLIVSGKALPNVPASHRPVVLVRDLSVLGAADAYSMLRAIFERETSLAIQRDNNRSALVLQGPPALVKHAAEVLDSLDQPQMRGRFALRIDPIYTSAEALVERLTMTLGAQGYDVGERGRNTVLIPVTDLESVFVFAPDQELLSLVRKWALELDQPVTGLAENQEGTFWYRVRNTSAAQLAITLNGVLTGSQAPAVSTSRDEDAEDRRVQGRAATGSSTPLAGRAGVQAAPSGLVGAGQFVVSEPRNLLLFRGEKSEWQRLLPLVRELDQAPDQVMVEVVVAEVKLTDNLKFGVEWALSDISAGGAVGKLGSVFGKGLPGSGLNSGGLTWTSISNSGQTRLALNAFASTDKVSILQTPRILVRSGESAQVKVGSEVPVLSRQSTSDQVDSGVIQDIQYRSTGVQLDVTPTVFSDGRIDLEISQEVSQASPTESSSINSPTILNRSLQTRLSLQDGSSVLLGGLISSTESKGNSRVPILGDLPWLGHLFRTDSAGGDRTELMMLIIPYLIKEGSQAEAITQAFRERLKLHPSPGEL